jgi:hypothetical protein
MVADVTGVELELTIRVQFVCCLARYFTVFDDLVTVLDFAYDTNWFVGIGFLDDLCKKDEINLTLKTT